MPRRYVTGVLEARRGSGNRLALRLRFFARTPPISPRRFPPPWTVEELDACFVVKDSSGQKLAYVYYEEEPGRRSAAKILTKDVKKLRDLFRALSEVE